MGTIIFELLQALVTVFGNLRGQFYLRTAIPQSRCPRAFLMYAKDHATL